VNEKELPALAGIQLHTTSTVAAAQTDFDVVGRSSLAGRTDPADLDTIRVSTWQHGVGLPWTGLRGT
jgi:hypothetical protein